MSPVSNLPRTQPVERLREQVHLWGPEVPDPRFPGQPQQTPQGREGHGPHPDLPTPPLPTLTTRKKESSSAARNRENVTRRHLNQGWKQVFNRTNGSRSCGEAPLVSHPEASWAPTQPSTARPLPRHPARELPVPGQGRAPLGVTPPPAHHPPQLAGAPLPPPAPRPHLLGLLWAPSTSPHPCSPQGTSSHSGVWPRSHTQLSDPAVTPRGLSTSGFYCQPPR